MDLFEPSKLFSYGHAWTGTPAKAVANRLVPKPFISPPGALLPRQPSQEHASGKVEVALHQFMVQIFESFRNPFPSFPPTKGKIYSPRKL